MQQPVQARMFCYKCPSSQALEKNNGLKIALSRSRHTLRHTADDKEGPVHLCGKQEDINTWQMAFKCMFEAFQMVLSSGQTLCTNAPRILDLTSADRLVQTRASGPTLWMLQRRTRPHTMQFPLMSIVTLGHFDRSKKNRIPGRQQVSPPWFQK